MMEKILKRDITGDCDESECRDRVKEGEEERQKKLKGKDVKVPEGYPKAPGAEKRDNPSGEMGEQV